MTLDRDGHLFPQLGDDAAEALDAYAAAGARAGLEKVIPLR